MKRRMIPIGWGCIRGYAAPKYENKPSNSTPIRKDIEAVARDVIAGKYGNGSERRANITKIGLSYDAVQKRVNEIMLEKVAREVLEGKWGNGVDRKRRLKAAGYDYAAVQKKVNEIL